MPINKNTPVAKAFPKNLKPMLATLVDKPFDKPGWIYEVKWDGYRAISFINNHKVEIKSRNNKSFNEKFYPVTEALSKQKKTMILDGEIVVLDKNGKSDFGMLQNWRSEADGPLYYYVFDILWLENDTLLSLPLSGRKKILKKALKETDLLRISESFTGGGIKFFETAKKMGLEGIIAKKDDSMYLPGLRSQEWLKIKSNKRQEMVIGGYTINEDTAKPFSSLLVGVFEGKNFVYTGKVGTGFDVATQQDILEQLKKLSTGRAPFTEVPDINKPSRFRPNPPHAKAYWVKPKLVCEVSFAEMTSDGVMRHPSFEGLRMDKAASGVKQEKASATRKIVEKPKAAVRNKLLQKPVASMRNRLLNPSDETQVKTINGHDLKFTNLGKLYWPKEKISKRDMINYYYQVAPFILPYLKGRPQSMNRHPDGINGESFYFKDVTGRAPSWAETYQYKSDTDGRVRNYLVAKDDASLLYMASLGCIEMNPWNSKADNEDYPDWCIIDLDPAKNTFEQVIKAAQVTKKILDDLGVESYPKTSGSTGIHIYIPLGAKYTYEQSREFARVIARLVHEQLPKFTSIERAVKDRKGKMYIDFLQNRPQATVSAPYSLRPKPGATVSMPLHWDEVKKGLKMKDFTIFNAIDRITKTGDLFKPVLGKGINLDKVVKKFDPLKQ
ncbi:MAG: DNA ligase D [Ferruginibacter sp.]